MRKVRKVNRSGAWRAVGLLVTGAALLGAVGGVGSMAVGNPGHALYGSAPVASGRPHVRRVPVTVSNPAADAVAAEHARVKAEADRLGKDWAACTLGGSVRCHVETDTDGTRSVYGWAPTSPAAYGQASPADASTPAPSAPWPSTSNPAPAPAPTPAPAASAGRSGGCSTDCGASPDDTPADVARNRYAECHDPSMAGWAAAHADYCARYGTGAVVPGAVGTFDNTGRRIG